MDYHAFIYFISYFYLGYIYFNVIKIKCVNLTHTEKL